MSTLETASFAEFASLAGFKRSYITDLKAKGRLVLTEDGKRVLVAPSLELIQATRDPARAGVAARHAAARSQGAATPAAAQEAPQGLDGVPDPDTVPSDSHAGRRSKALADKEEALARKALREEALELGQLMLGEEVLGVVASAITALRLRLESVAHDLAPQLAALSDEAKIQALLDAEIRTMLSELSRELGALAKLAGVVR